jgi:hypothetical protein
MNGGDIAVIMTIFEGPEFLESLVPYCSVRVPNKAQMC